MALLHDYQTAKASSYDRTGGNSDAFRIEAGATQTVMDAKGPGMVSHIWFTIATADPQHLKNLVLRMYWDGESEAQFRQSAPCPGWTTTVERNLDGKSNYALLEATGRGHLVGLTLGVVLNRDGWWGEGNDMLFVDGFGVPPPEV